MFRSCLWGTPSHIHKTVSKPGFPFGKRGAGSLTSDAIEYLQGKEVRNGWSFLALLPRSLPTSPWASCRSQGLCIEETCL